MKFYENTFYVDDIFEFEVHSLLLVASVASDIHSIPMVMVPGLNCTEESSDGLFLHLICIEVLIKARSFQQIYNQQWCRALMKDDVHNLPKYRHIFNKLGENSCAYAV